MMKTLIEKALPPLVDAGLFCFFMGSGVALHSSHALSFIVAMALNYLMKIRSGEVHRKPNLGLCGRLLVLSAMALFLRGGILAWLSLKWGWPAPVAIVFAVLAGSAVMGLGYAHALPPAEESTRTRALMIRLIAYAFALRLVYLGSIELLPEEAYYWNYSRHLDIGYLDHPPMVAWLISAGTRVFGSAEFGVRIGALCCGLVASFFTYRLTRNLFGEASALAALLLTQALPFFFLSAFLMTPDAALAAAWAASLYYLERALIAGRSGAWWRLGLAVGLGAISKYTIGLLVCAAALFMVWDQQARRWWRRVEPYGAALLALAVFSPVIVWNAQHEWASFLFQTSRRLAEAPRFALHRLIAAAIVLITPTGVLAVAAHFTRTTLPDVGDPGTRGSRLLDIAILGPLAVFALFSLRHDVKLDWTGAPWTAALPIMAVGMVAARPALGGLRAWIRAAWMPTVVTTLLLYGAGLHYLALGLPGFGYGKHIELIPVAWRDFSRQIDATLAANRTPSGRGPLSVGMDRYAIASELAFYGAKGTPAATETSSMHLFGGIGLMYERWTPAEAQNGRTLLLIGWNTSDLTDPNIESHFERLGPIEAGVLRRDAHIVRRYYTRLAYNYRARP